MKLKPKSTVLNPPALLYKRYTDMATSMNTAVYYQTEDDKIWQYNHDEDAFAECEAAAQGATVITVGASAVLAGNFNLERRLYKYDNGEWQRTQDTGTLALRFSDIANKYQLNRYYFYAPFSYMIKGSVEGTETQYVKGNIIPLTTLTIKYFDDTIHIDHDDLVVIGDRLFSIENITTDRKMQPRPFAVHFVTLNSVL